MPKRSSTRDPNEITKSIVAEVVDNVEDEPQPTERQKNPAAVELGRLGGRKGGPARAKKLTAEQRREIAHKAARARWGK